MKANLSERYTAEFIAQAEERRKKLAYTRLHVGENTKGRIDRVLALLYQTHQNYYFGYFNAACILGGVLFEQSLICLLEEEMRLKGEITIKQGKDIIKIDDPEGLANQSLSALVKAAGYYKIIPSDHFQLANELRLIRNHLIHDDPGCFMEKAGNYEFTLLTKIGSSLICSPISITISEAKEHCLTADFREIWAYYILTRTRHLIEHMFEERVKRLPPEKVGG